TEHGLVLVLAVVIAGDGSRPDVRVFADVRVADVAEVVRLGALLEARVLRLDEVADTHALAELRMRPEPREGAEGHAVLDPGFLHHAVGLHLHVAADDAVLDHRTESDHAPRTDAASPGDAHVRLDHHVGLDAHVLLDPGGAGIDE